MSIRMSTLTLRSDVPHLSGNLHSGTPAALNMLARREQARAAMLATDPTWQWLRVGEDLDGVNYSFDSNYRAYLISHHGYTPEQVNLPTTHWFFYRDFGQSDEEFVAACHQGVLDGVLFRTGDPFEGAAQSWADMVEAGHEIHIVTDRKFGSVEASIDATSAWLDEHGFWYDSLTISANKAISPDIDVFVEDRLENHGDLEADGTPCYLVTRGWNEDPWDTRSRVTSQREFADLVLTGQARTRQR
jgi:hypothetical protein